MRQLVGLAAAAAAMLALAPVLFFHYYGPQAHAVVDTTAALASFTAAGLVFGRVREHARWGDAAILTGLLLLAASTLAYGVLPELVAAVDADRLNPWLRVVGRLAGAASIAAGAMLPPRPLRHPGRAALGASAAAALLLTGSSLALTSFAPWVEPQAPTEVSFGDIPAAFLSWPLEGVLLVSAALWLAAAAGFYRRGRTGDELMLWFAGGSVVAAFASVQYALAPTLFTAWLAPGDVFRAVSYLVFLTGIVREIRRYQKLEAEIAVARERRGLARDIHDSIAQDLAQIVMLTADDTSELGAEARAHVAAAARRALVDVRAAIGALSGREQPLDVALAEVVLPMVAGSEVEVEFDVDTSGGLDAEIREAFLRIAREAASNAVRHGRARTISIEVRAGDSPTIRVVDDGVGFFPEALPEQRPGFGLISMTERIESLGGRFHVSSTRGHGTVVEATLR